MIRRILLLLALVYSALWFAGGYIAKNYLEQLISKANSDNITVIYKKSNLSGYPFNLVISLTEFDLTSISDQGSSKLNIPAVSFTFNSMLSNIAINLGQEVALSSMEEEGESKYNLKATEDLTANINLSKAALSSYLFSSRQQSLASNISDIRFDSPFFRINKDGKLFLQLRNFAAYLSQEYSSLDDTVKRCQIAGEITTNSKNNLTHQNNIQLDIEYIKQYTAQNAEHEYRHQLKFKNLEIDNNKSKISGNGEIEFRDLELLNGLFEFQIANISALESALKESGIKSLITAFDSVLEDAEIKGENAIFAIKFHPNSYQIINPNNQEEYEVNTGDISR